MFTTLNEGVNYLVVQPNRIESAKTGVSTTELQKFLKASVEGIGVDYVSTGNSRIPVVVRMDKNISNDPQLFRALEVPLEDA